MSNEISQGRKIQNTPKHIWDGLKSYQDTGKETIKCSTASGKDVGCIYPAKWECSDSKNYCGYCKKIEENRNSYLIWERIE